MRFERSTVTLAIAGIVAAVTVTGAVTVVVGGSNGSGSSDVQQKWSLSAVDVFGRNFAAFRNPTGGSNFDSDEQGFIDGGNTLITMIGLPNPRSYTFDKAIMVGVDARNGSVRWQVPAAGLGGCADVLVTGKVVCYAGYSGENAELVTVDASSGKVEHVPDDWSVFAIASDGERLMVMEGNPEDNDVRVHRLDPTDLSKSLWSRSFDIGASYEDLQGRLLTIDEKAGVIQMGGEVIAFDSDTGKQTWNRTLDDCTSDVLPVGGGLTVLSLVDCNDYTSVVGAEAVEADGHVLAKNDAASGRQLAIHSPSRDSSTILLGNNVIDRKTGKTVWSRDDLADPNSAVSLLGDVMTFSRTDPEATKTTTTAVDAATGHELWSRDVPHESAGAGVYWNGLEIEVDTKAGQGDGLPQSLRATDVTTGNLAWELPVRDACTPAGFVQALTCSTDDRISAFGR